LGAGWFRWYTAIETAPEIWLDTPGDVDVYAPGPQVVFGPSFFEKDSDLGIFMRIDHDSFGLGLRYSDYFKKMDNGALHGFEARVGIHSAPVADIAATALYTFSPPMGSKK
jgi:hypothetical protein